MQQGDPAEYMMPFTGVVVNTLLTLTIRVLLPILHDCINGDGERAPQKKKREKETCQEIFTILQSWYFSFFLSPYPP